MNKVVKRVGGVVFVVVIVLVVVVLVVGANLGPIVKASVENIGPKVTQSSVTLNEVNLSALSGKGELKGLVLGNPEGFRTESAIQFSRFNLEIDPKSVASDRIVIKDITIEGPEITYELGLKGSNIGRITKNAEEFGGGKKEDDGEKAEDKKPEKKKDDKEAGKKLQIDHLLIKDAKLRLSSTLPPITATLPLPDIEMTGIGAEKDGASIAEVIAAVMREIFMIATKVVKESGKLGADAAKLLGGAMADGAAVVGDAAGEAVGLATDAVKGVGDLGKGVGEGVGDAGKKTVDAVGGAAGAAADKAGDAVKGLGKLLGGKKD